MNKIDIDSIKKNPGTSESQITLFTFRIKHLTEHLKKHKKDFSTKRGLINLVGKRKRQLKYLQATDEVAYRALCKQLSLRR